MENGTSINVPLIENEQDFWDIIRTFLNGILAGNDLFISTPPQPTIDQSRRLLDSNILTKIEFC